MCKLREWLLPNQLNCLSLFLLLGRSFANLPDSLRKTSEMLWAACHPLTVIDIPQERLLSLATTCKNHPNPYLSAITFIVRKEEKGRKDCLTSCQPAVLGRFPVLHSNGVLVYPKITWSATFSRAMQISLN